MPASTDISLQEPQSESKSSGVADRKTPLLRNFWYVAAFANEITRSPLRRMILGDDIVLYRTEGGKAVAVQNRCPHRSFPLHKGELNGDRIVCPYHGMEFDPDGTCAHVPALKSPPRAIRLDAYPIEEDGPLVWIWMGDPARPDYSRLVRQEWCTSPAWTHIQNYKHVAANYLGLHENLMDLSHFAFLHAKWNLARPEHAATPLTIEEDGNAIQQREVHHDVMLAPALIEAGGLQTPIDRHIEMLVQMPGMHQAQETNIDVANPAKKVILKIVHMMTPETQSTTHYMWAIARQDAIEDSELSDQLRGLSELVFTEDQDALEEIEKIFASDPNDEFQEKIIKSDEGGIRVLRMFARWAAEERRERSPAIAAE